MPEREFWQFFPLPIQDGARLALRQTDRTAAINGLEKFARSVDSPFLKWQAAHSLGKHQTPAMAIGYIKRPVTMLELLSSRGFKFITV